MMLGFCRAVSGGPVWPVRPMSVVVLALAVLLTGCGDSNPNTVTVEGRVTLDGQPVGEGTVTFQPLEPAEGFPRRPAIGTLAADGSYRLSTFEEGDGAVPGSYQVVVVAVTGGPTPEEPDTPEVWLIPQRYGTPGQSPLHASVPAQHRGVLTLNFDLES